MKKIITLVLIVLTSFLFTINKLYALDAIVSSSVNMRTGPSTSYSSLGLLSTGTVISVIDTVSSSDSSCSTRAWYKYIYNGNTVYSCSSLFDATNKYNRPWDTPGKSIYYGAKYIANGYISKGQYTSYLTKFNVNPDSSYSLFTHQYMTNVRGAYFEANRTYSAYSNNKLLSQPLVFKIPIFNSMPAETILPGGTSTPVGQTIITDLTFEDKLNAQGFPEAYKSRLRELHTKYPSWTFESLKTNITWSTAVAKEQPHSYIDSSNTAYIVSTKIVEYPNWRVANSAVTAYYLDPRNFLSEQKIFMFLKLSYSSVETESVMSSMLQNTFMFGTSSLDKKTFAKLFVEAGSGNNVSPIFLVSKVIQEVGTNGSAATTGGSFNYGGITYQGIYNFYNIGAYTNVYDGLFWASVGVSITTPTTPITPTESTYLTQFGLTKKSSYVTGVPLGTTVAQVKENADNININITNSSNTTLSNSALISTGTKITISDGTNSYLYTTVIYGDTSGDGNINAIDLLGIRRHLLGTQKLTGANLEAAKIAKSSSLTASDLLYLRRYLLDSNTYKISQ